MQLVSTQVEQRRQEHKTNFTALQVVATQLIGPDTILIQILSSPLLQRTRVSTFATGTRFVYNLDNEAYRTVYLRYPG